MAVLNGVATEISPGVFVGARIFTEALGAGLPPAMTAFGQLAVNGVYEMMANAVVGPIPNGLQKALRYMSPNPLTKGGIGFNFAAPYSAKGEYVILGRWAGGNGEFPSVGWSMKDLTDATFDVDYMRNRNNANTIRIQWLELLNGAVVFHGAEANSGISSATPPEWVWLRVRVDQNLTPSLRVRAKVWQGEFEAEPVPFIFDNTGNSNLWGVVAAVGLAVGSLPNSVDLDHIAYFGFTSNPDSAAVPGPNEIIVSGDIFPPTLTVNPLQATYVGLVGSAFQVAP